MKKNVMMRVASALLVAVLMTTCAISGTFAKYTTSGTAEDSARVAKWGVTVTASGEEVFTEKYADVAGDDGTKVVSTVDVVAPGTKGSLASIAISGTPEVAVKVTYDAELTLAGWTTDGADVYCPIVFTVNGTDYQITVGIVDTAALEEAVEKAIEDYSKEYAANTDLSTVAGDTLTVSWRWDYTGNDDAKDTILGDRAADDNAATIELTVKTIVTQID